jgi:hypothetical protein
LGKGSKKIISVPDITGSKNKIVLLDSSHARKIGPMLGEILGKNFILLVFSNQMLLSQMLVRTWARLVKILPSKITLLQWVGQKTACIGIIITQ